MNPPRPPIPRLDRLADYINVEKPGVIIQALDIAARNAKNLRFDRSDYIIDPQMVVEVPDYARQYLIEHPEIFPPLSPCGADIPVREPESNTAAKLEPLAAPQEENVTDNVPGAKRRKNAAHGLSRGSKAENNPASKKRKNPERDQEKDIQRLQAAIEGAECGNWRDLRTVFEFVGIGPQLKDTPS